MSKHRSFSHQMTVLRWRFHGAAEGKSFTLFSSDGARFFLRKRSQHRRHHGKVYRRRRRRQITQPANMGLCDACEAAAVEAAEPCFPGSGKEGESVHPGGSSGPLCPPRSAYIWTAWLVVKYIPHANTHLFQLSLMELALMPESLCFACSVCSVCDLSEPASVQRRGAMKPPRPKYARLGQ